MKFLKNNLYLVASILAVILSPLLSYLTNQIIGYSLILFIPVIIIWIGYRMSKKEMGLSVGKPKDYLFSIFFPILTFLFISIIASISGQINFYDNPDIYPIRFPLILPILLVDVLITGLVLIVTEEGFFRGVLWGSLEKLKKSNLFILFYTGILFSIWHISALVFFPETSVSTTSLPIYLLNATLVSFIWGIVRIRSKSMMPIVLSHAIWNTYAYYLFGYGTDRGLLGITSTAVLDPERGILGTAIYIIVLGFMFYFNRNLIHQNLAK